MKLSKLMDPRLVRIGADVATLDEAIARALKNVTDLYRHEVGYEDALKRITERQELGGTTFDTGIAIPHARLPDFNDFIVAAVVPKKPVLALPSPDAAAIPVRVVFVVLISQTSSAIYLNALSKLMAAAKDERVMGALISAESPSRFVQVFEEKGYEVKTELLVSDVMAKEVVSVRRDATIKELTDLMYAKRLRYVPVVDADGRLVGEIGLLDLIRAGIPDYVFRVGSLKFLSELEPMTELLANEEKILVEAIMRKPAIPVHPTTPVVEAAFEMARGRKRHFAVVDGGALVGIISSMDILNKVLRA